MPENSKNYRRQGHLLANFSRNLLSAKSLAIAVATSFALLFASCEEKESDLGVDLQDPATLYNGIVDTAYGTAVTVFDDSLLTAGLSSCIIGNYSNPLFGTSTATLYTQVTTADNNSVTFDENSHIDSVVLTLAVSSVYSEASSKDSHSLHFEILQLDKSPMKDSAYYAFDELPVRNVCFFDDVVKIENSDTMIASMHLNDNFISLLSNHSYASAEEFADAIKGFRIRLVDDGTPIMATINLAASATRIAVHYTYVNGDESINRTYELTLGHSAPHFNQYSNNYTGNLSVFNNNTKDSIAGNQYLYLCPMGGTNVKLNFSSFVSQFKKDHPYAVIHYAELVLPVANIAPVQKPSMIATFAYNSEGGIYSIPDLYDPYTSSGYDGTYTDSTGFYRIRMTQYLQRLCLSGEDYGTLLVLNDRRSSAAHTILNGFDPTATAGKNFFIRFVYSE